MPKKLSLYKSSKTERGWRYCKAAFHPNANVKPNIVIVDGQEERHSEGAYFTLSDEKWVALGEDALHAQRKLMTMNAHGKPPSEFSLAAAPLNSRPPTIPTGLPSDLLERRPDVAAAERRMEEANQQIGIARAAYFPTVTLNGTAGFAGT